MLTDLHPLFYTAFVEPSAHATELNEMLDQYVTLMIHRSSCRGLQRLAGTKRLALRREAAEAAGRTLSATVLQRRCKLATRADRDARSLDHDIADLELLIQLYCERAIAPVFVRASSKTGPIVAIGMSNA